jgi:hypothetical protein
VKPGIQRLLPAIIGLLLLAGLGCGVIGFVENPAPLIGPAYWAAQTSTPIPTVTVFLGTTTPVYPATPVPGQITAEPGWTTVTATPLVPPPTMTPFGFTATPYWVTTTPVYITETPVPPWTTTPGLPQIGYTTPVPTETPYYRIGTFYMHSDVYTTGPNGLVFRLIDHQSQPSPRDEAATYHFLTVRVTNYSSEAAIVPASDLFFIRRVVQGEDAVTGRWVPQNEPLIARGLPAYETQQLDPIPPDGRRDIVLGFVVPNGQVPEIGLITNWQRPVEGGLPVWFYLEADPLGPLVDALQPPPPTPVVLDETWPGPGGSPGGGGGMWPTTGTLPAALAVPNTTPASAGPATAARRSGRGFTTASTSPTARARPSGRRSTASCCTPAPTRPERTVHPSPVPSRRIKDWATTSGSRAPTAAGPPLSTISAT